MIDSEHSRGRQNTMQQATSSGQLIIPKTSKHIGWSERTSQESHVPNHRSTSPPRPTIIPLKHTSLGMEILESLNGESMLPRMRREMV